MSLETQNNQKENLIQKDITKFKNQVDIPGKVTYIKESKDKKYDIYSYKLVHGGDRGGILKKYINQIGPRIEGTQFSDVNGNELKKERFEKGEIIYLRVPKENLIQKDITELKNQVDISGKVIYIKESKDRKYNIYSYKLVHGGDRGGILKKYINQIGPRIEGTQFSDVNGNELKKERFEKGEIIYLRVPKERGINNQKETKEKKGTPGKIEYLGNRKDKQNRNRKFYSYTFVHGGTIGGVKDKRYEQKPNERRISDNNFCDKNGNELEKEQFAKGETIYIRIPNTDIIDPTPEMSISEILNLNKDDLMKVLHIILLNHCDKNGDYVIINGKKLYYYGLEGLHDNTPYIDIYKGEGDNYVSIGVKVGNKIRGIYCNEYDDIYEGILKDYSGSLLPENFYKL